MFIYFAKSNSYPRMVNKTNVFQGPLDPWVHSDFHGLSTRPSIPKMLKEHHTLKEPFGVVTQSQIDATRDFVRDE